MKTERDVEIQIAILELEESKAEKWAELLLIKEKIRTLKWVIEEDETFDENSLKK
jgi:hypothetical protein